MGSVNATKSRSRCSLSMELEVHGSSGAATTPVSISAVRGYQDPPAQPSWPVGFCFELSGAGNPAKTVWDES